MFFAQSEGT